MEISLARKISSQDRERGEPAEHSQRDAKNQKFDVPFVAAVAPVGFQMPSSREIVYRSSCLARPAMPFAPVFPRRAHSFALLCDLRRVYFFGCSRDGEICAERFDGNYCVAIAVAIAGSGAYGDSCAAAADGVWPDDCPYARTSIHRDNQP